MQIFLTLIIKSIPLYAFMFLGYIAGKFFHVKKESIAALVIYIVAPIIFFNAAATTPLNLATIFFPILCFSLCLLMAIVFYSIGNLVWHNNTKNILAYTSSMGNIGYFGLPIALIVLPKEFIGPYLLGVLGMNVFDVSGAYFIVAHGTHTMKESIKRVLMLPTLYTFFVGILLQELHVSFGPIYQDAILSVRGSYVVLGMMLVGLGIAAIQKFSLDIPFFLITFLAKFLVWPALAILIISFDNNFFHVFPTGIHNALILLSIVPVAANSVAYSTQFNLHPEKAALIVVLSTLFALVYVPFTVSLLIH